jgi:two-component system response regulator ArlR
MRILIVEDELHLAEALAQILKKNRYTVDAVHDGKAGLEYALTGIYDLIVLDIMLPRMDGISVLRQLREDRIATPVILLTAKGDVADRVAGLDSGADDYLAKPFATEELLARIRAASRRRGEVPPEDTLKFGDIELDPATLQLSSGRRQVRLILKEKELLEQLIARKNTVTPKEMIIEKLWGFDSEAGDNHVEVYVSFLRKKLAFLRSDVSIQTVRGVGYRLAEKS